MKKITLKITDQQEKWLKQFAGFHYEGAEDNLGTYKPLHLVQTRERSLMHDGGGYGDDEMYFSNSRMEEFETIEEIMEAYDVHDYLPFEQDAGGCTIDSYLKRYGIEDVQIVSVVERWKTVSYHFTLQSAKEYIKYQRHNLRSPRTFTVSAGYSNKGDYEPIFDLLMQAGGELLEEGE